MHIWLTATFPDVLNAIPDSVDSWMMVIAI